VTEEEKEKRKINGRKNGIEERGEHMTQKQKTEGG